MDSLVESAAKDKVAGSLQATVEASLRRARAMLSEDDSEAAAGELEKTLIEVRANPYSLEFRTHIELGLALAEIYLEDEMIEKARAVLNERTGFAEKIFQIMQATGTT